MKTLILILAIGISITSCSKNEGGNEAPVVDNGPIGGNYNFTGSTTKTYDTIPGSGIVTINEYTSTTSNHKGITAITAGSITSKGLMYDYSTGGIRKEVNTTTGATVTTTITPFTGVSGNASSSTSSNYTIAVAAGELTINDAQYLFNPAFILLPANKKYAYVLSGNILTITATYYDAGTKHRAVSESSFTK